MFRGEVTFACFRGVIGSIRGEPCLPFVSAVRTLFIDSFKLWHVDMPQPRENPDVVTLYVRWTVRRRATSTGDHRTSSNFKNGSDSATGRSGSASSLGIAPERIDAATAGRCLS
jgi:hypothetical protein